MDYQAQMDYANKNNPFIALCGFEVTEVGVDYAVATAEIRPELLNPGSTVHGGALYTLADLAATTAARTNGYRYATIDGTMYYHKALLKGTVRETATIRHRGRSISAITVTLQDETGRLLADATFSVFRLKPICFPLSGAVSSEQTIGNTNM